jgi:hypothetical protein
MRLTVFLTSTVVAALVAGLVSLRVGDRRIAIENVTQERAKWRDKIRANASEACVAILTSDSGAIARLQSSFALLLNPHDAEDRAIVCSIACSNDASEQAEQFTQRVALLLKHDWERAKREARPWLFRGKVPTRTSYASYVAALPANHSVRDFPSTLGA